MLQGEIRNMHKKLEIYRKTNEQLRRQLEATSATDHMVQLENALAEKTHQVEQLMNELKLQKKALMMASRDSGTLCG